MTIKKYVSSTRRRTPWEDNANLSSLEVFINNEYHFHYDFHHSPLKNKETALLNSIEMEYNDIFIKLVEDVLLRLQELYLKIINYQYLNG